MTGPARRCGTCDHYEPDSETHGSCVRYAPRVVSLEPDVVIALLKQADVSREDDVSREKFAASDFAAFPTVGVNARCGEWAAKVEP